MPDEQDLDGWVSEMLIEPGALNVLPFGVKVTHMRGLVVDGQQIVMCHYAMRVWPGMHRGWIMLYGHSHDRLPGSRQTLDVGVDSVGFAPLDLPAILARMAALPKMAYDEGRLIEDGLDDDEALTV